MSAGPADGSYAVGLLISEAWAAMREARYGVASAAAERAVTAAEPIGDVVLLVQAIAVRAEVLRMSGDNGAALVDYTRILGLAEDPATAGRLGGDDVASVVASAYMHWVESALFRGGVAVRDLFAVLDAGERWMRVTGRPHWRAGLLIERAELHVRLYEIDEAIAFAEEAVAAHRPGAPGPSLEVIQFTLGETLRDAGRPAEAARLYLAILDKPDVDAYLRMSVLKGLAYCAVAERDHVAARRHAIASVRLAEGMNDLMLCFALGAMVAACLAGEDLDAAWEAATRHRHAAERIGGHHRLYYAVRDVVDVALHRGDVDTARVLLAELDGHAAALDGDTSTGELMTETAVLHERLAQLMTDTP